MFCRTKKLLLSEKVAVNGNLPYSLKVYLFNRKSLWFSCTECDALFPWPGPVTSPLV